MNPRVPEGAIARTVPGRCIAGALVCALVTVTACHNPDAFLLGPSEVDGGVKTATDSGSGNGVITVTLSRPSIPADSISRTRITIVIEPGSDASTVAVTTSDGELFGGTPSPATTTTVAVNSSNTAEVELQSSSTAGTATVTITVTPTSGGTPVIQTISVPFLRVTPSELFTLTPSPTSIPADGLSKVTVAAQITVTGDLRRNITFATSDGTLTRSVGSACAGVTNQGGDVCVTAGVDGRAIVELQTTTTVHAVQVTADLGGFVQTTTVNFVTARADSIFTFSPSTSSIPADGFSTMTLVADVTSAQRVQDVTFTTSSGTLARLVGAVCGTDTTTSICARTGPDGQAVVELTSGKTLETVQLTAKVGDFIQTRQVSFGSVDVGSVITLSASSSSGNPADGETFVTLQANVAGEIPDVAPGISALANRRDVTFVATGGAFLPGTGTLTDNNTTYVVKADSSNVARARLKSDAPRTVQVTAAVEGFSSETSVQFVPALPDTIVVETASGTIDGNNGGTEVITARLARTVGTLTVPIAVAYSAVTAAGVSVGSFSKQTLYNSAASPSTATLAIPAGTSAGTITVRATVADSGGANIVGTVTITVTNP